MKNILIGIVALTAATLLGGCARHSCKMCEAHAGGNKTCCDGKCECEGNKDGSCGDQGATCGAPKKEKPAGASCGATK